MCACVPVHSCVRGYGGVCLREWDIIFLAIVDFRRRIVPFTINILIAGLTTVL